MCLFTPQPKPVPIYTAWKVVESPEIKLLRYPDLERNEKVIGPGKRWKSCGILK